MERECSGPLELVDPAGIDVALVFHEHVHHDSPISKQALGILPSIVASVRSSPYVKDSRRQLHGPRARCYQHSSLPSSYLDSCATGFPRIMTISSLLLERDLRCERRHQESAKSGLSDVVRGGKKLRAFSIFSSIDRSWPRRYSCSLGLTCCFNDDRALSGPEPNAERLNTCHSFDDMQCSRVLGCVSDGKCCTPEFKFFGTRIKYLFFCFFQSVGMEKKLEKYLLSAKPCRLKPGCALTVSDCKSSCGDLPVA